MGGDINPDKLLALHNLFNYAQRVVLLGEFGIAAYLNSRGIQNLEEF